MPGRLVLGADVVPEVDRDDRGEVVLGDDDAQAVVEALVAERDVGDGGRHAWAPMLVGGVDRSAFGGCRPEGVVGGDVRRGVASRKPRRLGVMTRPLPVRRPGILLAAATALVLLLPGLAAAHAELQTATPADTAVVQGTPPEISGTYSERVKVDGSSLVLQDAGTGKELATGGVDPADDKRMAITPVPELVPGDYIVKSTTVSAQDNDIDRQQWIFTVVPVTAPTASASEAPTATPAPTSSASASTAPSASTSPSATTAPSLAPTPAPSPSGSGNSTGGGSDVLLPILVVLVLLAVLGGYLFTRRGSSTTPAP